MTSQNVRAFYEARAASFSERAEALRRRVRVFSNIRLIYFFALVVVLVFVERYPVVFALAVIIGLAIFARMVVYHRSLRGMLRDLEDRMRLCQFGIARIDRDWDVLPVIIPNPSGRGHPYADDLDLFGGPSVTQLFGPLRTLHGARTLRAWLEDAPDIAGITARQDAVRALAPDIDFRETLSVHAYRIPQASQRRVHAFLKWVDRPSERVAPVLVIAARAVPFAIFATIALAAAGLIAPVWAYLPIFVSVAITAFTVPRAYRAFNAAFTEEPAPLNYADTFAAAERMPAGAPLLQSIRSDIGGAARGIHRLEQIMHSSDARRSGIFAMVLEVLFLWSLNVLIALEKWRETHATDARTWFNALGQLEALCATATLAHDHPDWAFPNVDAVAERIHAIAIGHPMLRDDVRVTNDVEIGPAGSVLLITGSNMSGKSTLLRAVGVNTALAYAGAPVCAQSLRVPRVRLYTSINVRDSLAIGASLYMAQLARLKEIVDSARHAPADEPCCYLLDEILSGTNSADRTTAVRAIVHELLQLNAIGALTTHDLALAADAEIARHAVPIHFSETIDPATASMSFDYRIRPGIVQTSNALALMRLMGFRVT